MKNTDLHPAWGRLVRAARPHRQARAAAGAEAPFGFSTRVAALWRETCEAERRLALWQRLSWRAAACSAALCALVAVSQWTAAPSAPLLQPPALPFPGLDARP